MAKRLWLGCSFVVLALGVAPGCSSAPAEDADGFEDEVRPVVYRADVRKADAHLSQTVIVEPTRLRVPHDAENDAYLATLKVGDIAVGDRGDLEGDKNPYGFLRRVTAKADGPSEVVLETAPATLNDLVQEGDVLFGKDATSIFQDARKQSAGLGLQADPAQAPGSQQTGGNGSFRFPELALKAKTGGTTDIEGSVNARVFNATGAMNLEYSGRYQSRGYFRAPRVRAYMRVAPYLAADFEVVARGRYSDKVFEAKSPEAKIPVPAGVPTTLRVGVVAECAVRVAGDMSMTYRAELQGNLGVGFNYNEVRGFTPLGEGDVRSGVRYLGGSARETLTLECGWAVKTSLLLFDAVGLEYKTGPYYQVNGEICASHGENNPHDTSLKFSAYYREQTKHELAATLKVPVLGIDLADYALVTKFNQDASPPKYIIGEPNQCEIRAYDSCGDRADGVYCSQLEGYSAFECKGGQISGGLSCLDVTQRCAAGPGKPATRQGTYYVACK
jgi:hypothetical protein